MIKASGFMLLESALYFFLVGLLSMLLFKWAISLHCHITTAIKKNSMKIEHLIAFDVLSRNILQAPGVKKDWKKITPQEIIWPCDDTTDIGWLWEKDSLYRNEGHYSTDKKRWTKRTKSIVIHGAKGAFSVQTKKIGSQEMIPSVACTIDGTKTTMVLANRVLL